MIALHNLFLYLGYMKFFYAIYCTCSELEVVFFWILGNIANYLKLLEVHSIYLPVPVNFVFIGFEGNGNQGI